MPCAAAAAAASAVLPHEAFLIDGLAWACIKAPLKNTMPIIRKRVSSPSVNDRLTRFEPSFTLGLLTKLVILQMNFAVPVIFRSFLLKSDKVANSIFSKKSDNSQDSLWGVAILGVLKLFYNYQS